MAVPTRWQKMPQTQSPEHIDDSRLRNILRALVEHAETIIGRRGNARALLQGELDDLGLTKTVNGSQVRNKAAALTVCTTADATDEATAITLANDLKAKYNELVTKLKAVGITQ